jgi:hypothetical protein
VLTSHEQAGPRAKGAVGSVEGGNGKRQKAVERLARELYERLTGL